MNLKDISEKMIKAEENYAMAMSKLVPLEIEYTSTFNKLMLRSGMGSQVQREAEARQTLQNDTKYGNLFNDYHEAKLNARLAYSQKQTLIEISRNLRSLAFDE